MGRNISFLLEETDGKYPNNRRESPGFCLLAILLWWTWLQKWIPNPIRPEEFSWNILALQVVHPGLRVQQFPRRYHVLRWGETGLGAFAHLPLWSALKHWDHIKSPA
ncbi:hypothetical protein K440DRAFT_171426 [Wilcoxina mikolae CBS 423.85]|nr:hypothetical protein K440DRAFT_171426 [Wilcoxina mikolae CBS 423.85]